MKEANPRLIGAFVLGGVALAVAALVFLSSHTPPDPGPTPCQEDAGSTKPAARDLA